jgi:hypothetical protein
LISVLLLTSALGLISTPRQVSYTPYTLNPEL